jgi:hypothetical protein
VKSRKPPPPETAVASSTDDAGLKPVQIFEKSGAAWRTGQGGLEEPADEFRMTVGSGFRENVLRVGARRRLGDFEFLGRSGSRAIQSRISETPVAVSVSKV